MIETKISQMVEAIVDQRINQIPKRDCDDEPPNRYLTVRQAAEYLNVHVRSVYNYLRDGLFNKIYFGNSLRIDKEEIIDFANQQKIGAA